MLRSRLRGRASKALVGVGRHLSRGGTAVVESAQLLQALRTFHISITQEVHMCSGEVTVGTTMMTSHLLLRREAIKMSSCALVFC